MPCSQNTTRFRPPESRALGTNRPSAPWNQQALVECFQPDGGTCTLTAMCQLKRPLAAAQEAFFQVLDVVSLADCALGPPE